MTLFLVLVLIILVLVLACVVLFCVTKVQVKRADTAVQEAVAYQNGLAEVRKRTARLQETAAKDTAIKEAAHEERETLAGTPDTDLVRRANTLFGVPDGQAKR